MISIIKDWECIRLGTFLFLLIQKTANNIFMEMKFIYRNK